jgi:trypsin
MVRQVSNDSVCNYTKHSNETFYCAIVSDKVQDTCDGDSGGPLMRSIDGIWYLYGLTSFGDKSCDPKMPSYYTKISFYFNWILSNINED